MTSNTDGMIQSGIFEDLQKKIDEDTQIKDVHSSPAIPVETGEV